MIYEPNPKHKEPWQPGRKGSLCPAEITPDRSQQMLEQSETDGAQRFATWNGRAYCGSQHEDGRWHGWPVGWVEVPERIRRKWQASNMLSRGDVNRYWLSSEDN